MSDTDTALSTAEKICTAVVKKFPKHTYKVRRYDTGDGGFIELALCPEQSSKEITTAYSDEFFLSATKENINDKARRVLGDFKILIGAT